MRYRATWPITDPDVPQVDLIAQAAADLPAMTAEAGVTITGHGTWFVAPAAILPSRSTSHPLLVFVAPARPSRRRAYRHG